jgi:hypothetical protein
MLFSKRKENLPTAGGRVEPDQWDIGRCSIIIEVRNAIAPLLLGSTGTFQRRGGSLRTICDGNTTRLPADVRFRCDSGILCEGDRRPPVPTAPQLTSVSSFRVRTANGNSLFALRKSLMFQRWWLAKKITRAGRFRRIEAHFYVGAPVRTWLMRQDNEKDNLDQVDPIREVQDVRL